MKDNATPVLKVKNLVKHYATNAGTVRAVDDVSFVVNEGETLGVVGESGCGKSTMGRTLVRLLEPNSGTISFMGQDITHASRASLREVRRDIQMVFQDPYASLNPRRTVRQILAEPFDVHGIGRRSDRAVQVSELLDRVGLHQEHADRYSHEFSGGQRQRVAIARAIALEPKVVVCDEPVSALDVSIQAQIINLLKRLQAENGLAYVFISHDLSVVGYLADRIAVMYLGEIVEIASKSSMWEKPLHPYTQVLFSAIPVAKPPSVLRRHRQTLIGELPSPINPPQGCRFHTRCPHVMPKCSMQPPKLKAVAGGEARGHQVACHLYE
ncbi:ABC transporter ATP-binding protein [Alcaligenes endophyticus]|uniref:Dipeptide ABC transporter ATP-binding protein n=1 Tax=Alcaligenes endophyticus TaxID=1929088 RepID=A0ABT8EHQ8_9BURK|nr:dipeptide ABC transporter ATP-binding protein [Alcaligenes endophyticus]MCX5592090.1 dipeptide ABC transporter ATP-binding protein [Alcaligenes endophyticus]MDN4120737.1 dipeptide ABC transporter ATP-binding protein [Alcaligenes endophyticus]